MEVSFNGKKISITNVGTGIFDVYAKRVKKNIGSSKLPDCFGDAYRVVLSSRLGKTGASGYKSGIATESLINSIKIKKQSASSANIGKHTVRITMIHTKDYDNSGWYIGGNKYPFSTKTNDAVGRLTSWIHTRGASNFSADWYKGKPEGRSKAIAKAILYSWRQTGTRTIVLPKWYDVFKDGGTEALNQLYNNKGCLETNIKKLLSNG